MAEQSEFWTTSGTGDGPVGGYSQQRWYDFLRKFLTPTSPATEGVLAGLDNELAVSGTATPLAVATGGAMVYGFFYENTTSLSLAVTTPAATAGGRVVLEVNWTAQTVRAKISQSASGVVTPPALTQTAGTTWQISLATYTITSSGVITVTDDRARCHFGTRVKNSMVDTDAAIAYSKLALAGGVVNADIGAAAAIAISKLGAITAGSVLMGNASNLPTATALSGDVTVNNAGVTAVGASKVLTGMLAASAVDYTKIGDRGVISTKRQGGDPTDWDVKGSTNYDVSGKVLIQCGVANLTSPPGYADVVFPVAFSAKPIVICQLFMNNTTAPNQVALGGTSYRNYATGFHFNITGTWASPAEVEWIAIGPA